MVAGAGHSGQPTTNFTELSRAAVAESRHPCQGVLPGDAAAFEPPLPLTAVTNPNKSASVRRVGDVVQRSL